MRSPQNFLIANQKSKPTAIYGNIVINNPNAYNIYLNHDTVHQKERLCNNRCYDSSWLGWNH